MYMRWHCNSVALQVPLADGCAGILILLQPAYGCHKRTCWAPFWRLQVLQNETQRLSGSSDGGGKKSKNRLQQDLCVTQLAAGSPSCPLVWATL